MEEVYLYTHLGLGDMLICNGLVREIYKNNKKINLFCKPKYLRHAKKMYEDIDVNFIPKDDIEAILYLNQKKPNNVKVIGHGGMQEAYKITNYFNVAFYILADVHYTKQWTNFYLPRDTEEEEFIFSELSLNKEKYVFLHEDASRGYLVDRSKILDKSLRIISPSHDLDKDLKINNIFSYSKLLENASEIHAIDSSFFWLADHTKLKTNRLFLHLQKRHVPSMTFYNWEKIF